MSLFLELHFVLDWFFLAISAFELLVGCYQSKFRQVLYVRRVCSLWCR